MHHREKRYRSLAKAIVYRIISIGIDYTVAYLITGDFEKSTMIAIFSNTISLVVYFIHERAWNRVMWGRHTNEAAELIISGAPLSSLKKQEK